MSAFVVRFGEMVRMDHCDLVTALDMDLGTVTVIRTSHHQARTCHIDIFKNWQCSGSANVLIQILCLFCFIF